MMKYNEWKMLQESVAPGYSLGLKTPPTVGGPVGSSFWEGGFNFGGDEDDEDEDGDDDEAGDDEPVGDDELEDDQLDGDVFGASKEEGGPSKGFPPDDSEDLDSDEEGDSPFGKSGPFGGSGKNDNPFGGKGGGGDAGGEPDMAAVLGGIDPDLAGLGDDGMSGPSGAPVQDLAGGLDGAMGGMGGGDDEMSALTDLTGGSEMGDEMGGLDGAMGDEGGDMGEPCPDCNPEGMGEPDPECQACGGEGFIDAGGEMGMGGEAEVDGSEIDPNIEKMNLMSMMKNYQKKYMPAATGAMAPQAGAAMGQVAANMMQKPMGQMGQMQRPMGQQQQKPMGQMGQQPPQFSKKFMGKNCAPTGRKHMAACAPCRESVAGTYTETHDDFLATLTNSAKGYDPRRKWSSGIYEDALLQAVDPTYQPAQPKAGDVGFAPQSRVGAIGGGYTQQDIQDLPVLGESKKYPTLDEYRRAKKAAKRR